MTLLALISSNGSLQNPISRNLERLIIKSVRCFDQMDALRNKIKANQYKRTRREAGSFCEKGEGDKALWMRQAPYRKTMNNNFVC